MGARRFAWLPLAAALAGALLAAAPAQATFHLMKIREVYPGGSNNASYVELQMYAAGQTFVATHHLVAYNSDGSVNDDFQFTSDVTNGASQATILVADTNYSVVFNEKPAPDATDEKLNLSPAGGAVCWVEGSPPDCVAWGSFTGPLPSHIPEFKVGNPASPGGVAPGEAIRRTIAPGCSTLLEATDDSDDSAADFSEQAPSPRDNASPIAEMPCTAPTATIDSKPANPTKETSGHFTYHSTPTGASFRCKLDTGLFESCEAGGKTYAGPLSEGSHTFEVEATNVNGTGSPATYTWTVDTTPPLTTILSHPQDPSPGNSAAFTYSSNETGSTFQCSLEPTGEAAVFTSCPSTGKTYPDAAHPAPLADGKWTFEARATDRAGNQGSPAVFEWTVNNSLADTTPPETTIVSKPPDPSESPAASFGYESNEPGSSFECELDGAGFASCPAAGVTYAGLAEGPHAFQVRAIDSSGNVDPTPAGYSFDVVVAPPPAPPPPPNPPSMGTAPPATRLLARLPARTRDRTPTIHFSSSVPGSTFQCAVDRLPFRTCRSPFTTKPLSLGRHLIRVRAIAAGLVDPTPAAIRIRVVHSRGGGR